MGDQEADDGSVVAEKTSEKEVMMALCVYTAQMDRKWRETPTALDTTIKSTDPLGRVFAPDDARTVFRPKHGPLPPAA